MTSAQRSAAWERLRAVPEARVRERFRGGWVPRQPAAASSGGGHAGDAAYAAVDAGDLADAAAVTAPETAPAADTEPTTAAAESVGEAAAPDALVEPSDPRPTTTRLGAGLLAAARADPPRLSRAHAGVAVLVGALALVATLVVLSNAQPVEQPIDLTGAAATASDTAPTTPAGAPTHAADQRAVGVPTSSPLPSPPAPRGEVVVHVAGLVAEPGIVRLPSGSRVAEAVEAAGGALPDADLSGVNLARVLADGEQVRVGIPPDPSVAAPSAAGPAPAGGQPDAPVDVNTADASALETLPGVGPVLAERIVAYREQNGGFQTLDQLLEVPGIGPAVLGDIQNRVSL